MNFYCPVCPGNKLLDDTYCDICGVDYLSVKIKKKELALKNTVSQTFGDMPSPNSVKTKTAKVIKLYKT